MRTLKKYVPRDDFGLPKQIDRKRFTAILIRQSDHRAGEDHIFSREGQLKLVPYAMRLRGDETDEWVRVYDEGAGVSGQKRIDQREELNRLYNDIKHGVFDSNGVKVGEIGSLVIVHEDRLFRDKYHTNDTTFIQLLAERDILLFVRTDHRRYDCTKPSDRNALLDKMIASRNYLDDQVLGRMNGAQEAKALEGLFTGRNLPMGLVTKGKKKEQKLLVYEPWREIIVWLFKRFKELDNVYKLGREIEAMPFLFPDPPIEDLLQYTFSFHMSKVPGGFKPACIEAVKYMLSNLAYAGALIYKGALVRWDNHEAIIDRELALWAYHKITGRDIEGNLLEGIERRRLRDDSPQAVLKYLIHDPAGALYVLHDEHPEYVRQSFVRDNIAKGKLFREHTFSIRAHLIDGIFLERVKEIARTDPHLAQHIETSITELEEAHAEKAVSIKDQLTQVRLKIEKTRAVLHDKILTLEEDDKKEFNKTLKGLRELEKELLEAQEQATQADLKADYEELSDLLADIPGKLDACSMAHKQKLARLITEDIMIEEISVHWLRFTVIWRGPLAIRPDVCFIWRQRGRRSNEWTPEEDEYIKANYPTGDKWTMLEALPRRSWNMIYQRALTLGAHRDMYVNESIPNNITVDDLNVIPDRELAMKLVTEASKRRKKNEFQAYGIWLYSADLPTFADEIGHRNTNIGSLPIQAHSRSSGDRLRVDRASICL
jgi:DNA invertase Pin-like site-specific DNA recombinase